MFVAISNDSQNKSSVDRNICRNIYISHKEKLRRSDMFVELDYIAQGKSSVGAICLYEIIPLRNKA